MKMKNFCMEMPKWKPRIVIARSALKMVFKILALFSFSARLIPYVEEDELYDLYGDDETKE